MNKSVDVLYQLATNKTEGVRHLDKLHEMLDTIIDLDLLNKAIETYAHGIWDNGLLSENVKMHFEAVDKAYKKIATVDGKETFEGKLFLVLSVLALLQHENFVKHSGTLFVRQLMNVAESLEPEGATVLHLKKLILAKQIFAPIFPIGMAEELAELRKFGFFDEDQEDKKEQE